MADKFDSFNELRDVHKEGCDFSIEVCEAENTSICIVAPHAGKIEFQTGELASEIAGQDYCLYKFSGKLKNGNRDLHITSHNFNEPSALVLLSKCQAAIGIHGRTDKANVDNVETVDTESIFLGGRDSSLIAKLESELNSAGFECRTKGHRFMAKNLDNVCNRGTTGKGAQLELPKSLRNKLKADKKRRKAFIDAVRAAIAHYLETLAR